MMRYLGCFGLALVLTGCGGQGDTVSAPSTASAQVVSAQVGSDDCSPPVAVVPTCMTVNSDGFEPPCNPHLAQDAWSASHRNNFSQDSSPLPGVTTPESVNIDHTGLTGVPIGLNFSERDTKGHQAIWGSTVGPTGEIDKLDGDSLQLLARYIPNSNGAAPSVSGAYNLLDRDQNLIVGKSSSLDVLGDAVAGDHQSGIQLLKSFALPASASCGTRQDELVGITMLPDGYVAFATKFGIVGVVPRQPKSMCAGNMHILSINGAACADSTIPDSQLEQVSNSIAADETSSIYVVTSGAQYRINWNGSQLSQGWRAAYSGAGGTGSGRLGSGSGSTPTLMGQPGSANRFVVITDGQAVMNLDLMWQNDIPADWTPIKPGLDRRIACEVPVTFGDPAATQSLSEQSVLVRGFASVVVSNLQTLNGLLAMLPSQLQPYTQLLAGLSINRPHGLERIDWDPRTRTCKPVWSNSQISIPNGIPSMSASTGQIFGIGSRTLNGIDTWTLESVDFNTGTSRYTIPSTPYPTDNSFYASTIVGAGNSIWTGTFGGVTRFSNCTSASSCGRRGLSPLQVLPAIPKN